MLGVANDDSSIVVVSPDHRDSVTSETPLGTLRVHVVNGPEEVQP